MPGKYEATASPQIRIRPRVRDGGFAVSSYVCDLRVTEMEAHSTMAGSAMSLQQAVPFFLVSDMEASVRFYVDGLGFEITEKWIFDGTIRVDTGVRRYVLTASSSAA